MVINNRLSTGPVILTAAFGMAAAMPLRAQTASQITPPSFAPPAPRAGAPVVIPEGKGAQAPPGSEALEVRLSDVAVEGHAIDPAALAELKAKLTGHVVKVSEIFAAARALEAAYARAGHVLVRVTVPPQSLADGAVLRLVVVAGFLERIDTEGVPARVRRRIAAILAPLQGEEDVTLARIERRLLLAADVPGVSLRSTLAAGTQPGATVLVVEATQRPVSGFLTLDNTLPAALGRYAYGAGVTFNSVLGAGETLYLRASGLPNTGRETSFLDATPRDRALAAGAIVPIGHDGLSLNVEGTDARTAPRHDAAFPGFGSRFQRLSGRVRYPFVRTRALTMSGELSFDAQDERVRIIDPVMLTLSIDRLRVARATGDISLALPGGGLLTQRLQASFGLDALGARSAADATETLPLSRAGEHAGFQKIEVDASLDQPLARHLAVALRARAQTSFGEVMANSEQIGIATLDGLSPLPSGTLQGDAGYVVRGELQAPFPVRTTGLFGRMTPYGFVAQGRVRYEQPTLLERRATDAYAYGAGLRLTGAPAAGSPGLSAGVEYGRAHVDGLPGHPDRLSFTIVTQF